jgi:surface antigen
LKTYDNKIFYVLSIGVIVAFWIQTEVLADPFGTPLGSYKGTVAYSNSNENAPKEIKRSGWGRKWQCVEYVNRFYNIVMCMGNWYATGDAHDYWDNFRDKGLERHDNGDVPPQLYDILVWGTSVGGGEGHVAIVSEVRTDKVGVIEQNVRNSQREWESLSVSRYIKRNGNELSSFPGDPVPDRPKGWLRVSDGQQNGTLQQIDGTLSEGDEQLNDGSFFDLYSFEGVAGQTAIISMTSYEIDTYLILCFNRPDGVIEEVSRNDDYCQIVVMEGRRSDCLTDSRIELELPKTGTYLIVANSYSAGETGRYTISRRLKGEAQERGDPFEVDDKIDQAKMIATDGSKQSHTFHKAGDIDWIKFFAWNTSKYTIETSNLKNCDTVIELYDLGGNFIQKDDDGGVENRASKISDWQPKFNRWYFIKVWEYYSKAGGSYEISIKEAKVQAAPMLPERTFVGTNYPNPLNPETWIPFQLAESARVTLTIYDATGKRIRLLDLGYMPPGYYTTRGRAAYWDGRNDEGERVSSGVYFYELSADNFKSVKKMVILK